VDAKCIDVLLEKKDVGKVIVSRRLDQFPWFTVVGESKILVKVSTEDSVLVGEVEEYDKNGKYQGKTFEQSSLLLC